MAKPFKHLLLCLGALLIIASCLTETPKGAVGQGGDEFIKPVEHYKEAEFESTAGAAEPAESENPVSLTIPEGASGSDVAALLFQRGLIDDKGEFEKRLMELKLDRRIIQGVYNIQEGEDVEAIIEKITSGSR